MENNYLDLGMIMLENFRDEQSYTHLNRLTHDGLNVSVGASVACPRRTYFDYAVLTKNDRGLKEFIVMRKGNVSESLVELTLDSIGIPYEPQGEYVGKDLYDFMFVHPDILIDLDNLDTSKIKNKKVRDHFDDIKKQKLKYLLVELKTSNSVPSEPHDYWVKQVSIQIHIIAEAKGIEVEEIGASVFVMELDYGFTGAFQIEYDEESVIIALEELMQLADALQDLVDFQNHMKDSMEFSSSDVPYNLGNLCSFCDHQAICYKGFEQNDYIALPEEYAKELVEIKRYRDKKNNFDNMAKDISSWLVKSGVRRGVSSIAEAKLRGGNKKVNKEVEPKDIKKLYEEHPEFFVIDQDRVLRQLDNKKIAELFIVKEEEYLTTVSMSISIK